MDTSIEMIAAGYVLARIGIIVAFAYLLYRVLRRKPDVARVESQSNYAEERRRVYRRGR